MSDAEMEKELERQRERIHQTPERCKKYRILSTLPFTKTLFWTESVEMLPSKLRAAQRPAAR